MRIVPSLSPHPQSPIEWWYVQGELRPAGQPPLAIMVSLFRGAMASRSAAMAFVAVHGLRGFRRSLVSPAMIAMMEAAIDRVGAAEAPAIALAFAKRAFRRMACRHERDGLCITEDDALLSAKPFAFMWRDLHLQQEGEMIRLRFSEGLERYDLCLTPERPWSSFAARDVAPGLGIDGYRSCPRLAVGGTVSGVPVEGHVWLDHQWGTEDQIVGLREGRIMLRGWNWFPANFDDGSDLMLYLPRDVRHGCDLPGFGAYWQDDRWQALDSAFSAKPTRWLRSAATGHRYPVEWSIHVATIGAALTLKATTAYGEIPIYGPMGWNWQSPARVYGTMAGRAVRGRAWLELNGYGYPLRFTDRARWFGGWVRSFFGR